MYEHRQLPMSRHSKQLDNASITLRLSIVKLDHSISQLDRPITDIITRTFDQLSCMTPNNNNGVDTLQSSPSSTASPSHCNDLREQIEISILRYRREPDRWTALTSLLLKSVAYHRSKKSEDALTLTSEMDKLQVKERKNKLSIVHLPRTKYNRPYIPREAARSPAHICSSCSSSDEDTEVVDENCNYKMNVSHQYPWVCMVQQQLYPSSIDTTMLAAAQQSCCNLGLDVVIFDAKLNEYMPSISEFLKSFTQSFTSWEWDRITKFTNNNKNGSPSPLLSKISKKLSSSRSSAARRSDESKLKEFYLRWAMKEAYTKALGLGLNMNFNEFETRLVGIDYIDDNVKHDTATQPSNDIWSSIMTRQVDTNVCDNATSSKIGRYQFSVVGKVKNIKSSQSQSSLFEYWEFIFIPLVAEGSKTHPVATGCACICRGPLAHDMSDNKTIVSIEVLTLTELIGMHGGTNLI